MKLIYATLLTLLFTVFSASSMAGESNEQKLAKDIVLKYYQLSNNMQMDDVRELFDQQASINMTWKYGSGYPDDVIETTVAELEKVIDEDAIKQSSEYMGSYEELTSEEKIVEIAQEKERIVVEAIQTVGYKIEGYEGQSKQTDIFFLQRLEGTLKIVEMESVLKF